LGLLRCHPVAAIVGFFLFVFLRDNNKIISYEELDELVEVELDLPSSWGSWGRRH
jgi:hypothetical protein